MTDEVREAQLALQEAHFDCAELALELVHNLSHDEFVALFGPDELTRWIEAKQHWADASRVAMAAIRAANAERVRQRLLRL